MAKKYTLGLQTILFQRGAERVERVIDGITFVGQRSLPDLYHFRTAAEGDFYLLVSGEKAPGSDADLAAEFAVAEVSERPPRKA